MLTGKAIALRGFPTNAWNSQPPYAAMSLPLLTPVKCAEVLTWCKMTTGEPNDLVVSSLLPSNAGHRTVIIVK